MSAGAAQHSGASAIDRFYAALSQGDVAAARACCTDDAQMWHNFDGLEQDLDQAVEGWTQFVASFSERAFVDVQRSPTPDGFVQQHLLVALTHSGARIAWPICVLVKVRDDRIVRLDEYIDRAGVLPMAEGDFQTPGLPRT